MQDCFPDTGSHYVVIIMGMFTPVVMVMVSIVMVIMVFVVMVFLTEFKKTHSDSRAVCVSLVLWCVI